MTSKSLREQALTALRQLADRGPTLPEIESLFTSFKKGDDRSCAILAASVVDEAVKHALVSQFRNLTSGEFDRLFGPDQPLGTFSAKIKLAYALRLCDRQNFRNLDGVRAIRNAFAHTMKPMTFQTVEVIEVCYHFYLPNHIPKGRDNPRERFLWTATDLSEKFWTIAYPEADEQPT